MVLTKEIVVDIAKKLGFDLVGFAMTEPLKQEIIYLEEYLKRKFHAGMDYMSRNIEKRKDVTNILEDAKSVISLGTNYFTDEDYSNIKGYGKISRYAWGKDYHLIIWEKLDLFINKLREIDPGFSAKSYVDTGPVMDKTWAVKAGLGWLGKHTNVINKKFGSWIFLSTVITNREFEYSGQVTDLCGKCRLCIDACPTNAIVEEYVLDSNRCISYLTIENKEEISEEYNGKFDNWLFGCDTCQDVCPWNIKFAQQTKEINFLPNYRNKEVLLDEVILMDQEEFDKRFFNSPVKRAKLSGLKRSAKFLNKQKY